MHLQSVKLLKPAVTQNRKEIKKMYCRNCGKEVNENAAACGAGLCAQKGGRNSEGKSKMLIGSLACIPFV